MAKHQPKVELTVTQRKPGGEIQLCIGSQHRKQRIKLEPEDALFLSKLLSAWARGEETLYYFHTIQGDRVKA